MHGVWTALITPFNSQNELDLVAFRKVLRDQVDAGVSGVIPCGTTGESPTLSIDEKKQLIVTALKELQGTSVQVFAGTGSNDTQETVEFSKWASDQGVQGVLVVTPYYNRPSAAGLEAHFKAVADAVSCEVMLYNVPARTGVQLSLETLTQLAAHPRIRSLKEANGNVTWPSEVHQALQQRNLHLDILSGDDILFLPLLAVGAKGVVSVTSNLFPRAMVAIQKAMESQNLQEALAIHRHYYPLLRDLFIEANPMPIKYAMAYAGWCDGRVRLPLAPISSSSIRQLEVSLQNCGIKKGQPS